VSVLVVFEEKKGKEIRKQKQKIMLRPTKQNKNEKKKNIRDI